MKRILKKTFLVSFFIFFITFLPSILNAQGSFDGGGGSPNDPACDPQCNCRDDGHGGYIICPIDSNLYILLGIGVLYGIKKITDQKKKLAES